MKSVPCSVFYWILLGFLFLIGVTAEVHKTAKLTRRKWPNIKWEDLYSSGASGDGPDDGKSTTSSDVCVTIITETKYTVFPTVTRIKPSSPHPQLTSSPSHFTSSSRNFISVDASSEYEESNSNSIPRALSSVVIDNKSKDASLSRSSFIYPGPSSSVIYSSSSQLPVSNFPSVSSKEFESSFVLTTSSYQGISSSSGIIELTPSFQSSIISESDSRNFQTLSTLSSIQSSFTPVISSSNDLLTSSFFTPAMTSVRTSLTTSMNHSHPQSIKPTIIIIPTTILITTSTSTMESQMPTATPLCPPFPSKTDQPSEDYLIRTVLNRKNLTEESILNVSLTVEGKIRQIFIKAYGEQLDRSHANANGSENTRKIAGGMRRLLDVGDDAGNKVKDYHDQVNITVWNIYSEDDELHVIYSVEQNGLLVSYDDVSRTLSHISDSEFTQIMGLDVIAKVKPYLVPKQYIIGQMSFLSMIMIACSVLSFIIFFIASIVIFCKYRSAKRKWSDAFKWMELNRVGADNSVHWRTVSSMLYPAGMSGDGHDGQHTNTLTKTIDSRDEFHYVPFEAEVKSIRRKKKTASKAVQSESMQSTLELQKEKVVTIGSVVENDDRHELDVDEILRLAQLKTIYVTSKEIETNQGSDDDDVPRLIQVQMSEQTQTIIKAIRNELSRFGTPELPSTPPPNQSIISYLSEA